MRFISQSWTLLAIALVVALPVSRSFAQTDPTLLVKPWQAGQALDTSFEAVLESSAPSKENHQYDVGLSSYHAFGRWRIFPDMKATPAAGV